MTPPEDQTLWQWLSAGIAGIFGIVYSKQNKEIDNLNTRLDNHIRSSNETYVTRNEVETIKELLLEILQTVRKDR